MFSARSYVNYSPSGLQRIYTPVGLNRLLLTAQSHTHKKDVQDDIVMGLQLEDSPPIKIGHLLLSLEIPLFGMITGLLECPSPLDSNTVRVIILYHPLPKPNIENL